MHHRLPNHLSALRKSRKGEGGFTLIELLIVIVILGVLAAIVAFSVRGITDRGEEAACKAEVKTVATAVEAFYAKNGAYPATVTATAAGGFLRSADTEYVDDALGAGGTMTLSSSPGTCAAA